MKSLRVKDLKWKELAPGIVMRSVHLSSVMVTFIDLAKGSVVPVHSHPHEQITVVVSGSLYFTLEGEGKMVGAGEVVLIPGGASHGVRALEDSVAHDSFSPIREDYILDR